MTGLRYNLVAAFLVGLFAVAGGALPAMAHGSHSHGVGVRATASKGQQGQTRQPSIVSTVLVCSAGIVHRLDAKVERRGLVAGLQSPEKFPDPPSGSECCCGSAVCHAGVAFAVTGLVLPSPHGDRVKGETSFGQEQRLPSGLERPPRGARTL